MSGKLWINPSAEPDEPGGFFTHPDGRLLLLADFNREGLTWDIHEGSLLLWVREPSGVASQLFRYDPVLVDEQLGLTEDPGGEGRPFLPARLAPLRDQADYIPLVMMNRPVAGQGERRSQRAYLRFDLAGSTFRGFAGVNNYRGSYRLDANANFNVGPIMTTRMVGPGMDKEIQLLQCLEEAGHLLTHDKRLYFYHGGRLQCSFAAE